MIFAAVALFCATEISAQITVVKNGKARSRIVLTTEEKADSVAASLLRDFVHRISGAMIPVVGYDNIGKVQFLGMTERIFLTA